MNVIEFNNVWKKFKKGEKFNSLRDSIPNLFRSMFAKKNGGELLLRIEDTDQKRFVAGSMDRFFEDLKWLGITFDADPVIQSSNTKRHIEVAEELIKRGSAYYEAVENGAGNVAFAKSDTAKGA